MSRLQPEDIKNFVISILAAVVFTIFVTLWARRQVAKTRLYRWWHGDSIRFVPVMSLQEFCKRIRSAQSEIWSFQISGEELTRPSLETYDEWLAKNNQVGLKILFADPRQQALLESILKLKGTGKISNHVTALADLREAITTSIGAYLKLRDKFNGRVQIRVYSCSPPFSVHAVDAILKSSASSIFVETYLHEALWEERTCFLLHQHHSKFKLYSSKCQVWFEDSEEVRSIDQFASTVASLPSSPNASPEASIVGTQPPFVEAKPK